jgi:hypothetical protein
MLTIEFPSYKPSAYIRNSEGSSETDRIFYQISILEFFTEWKEANSKGNIRLVYNCNVPVKILASLYSVVINPFEYSLGASFRILSITSF